MSYKKTLLQSKEKYDPSIDSDKTSVARLKPVNDDTRILYDVDRVTLYRLHLKGIGRYCRCGCGRHLTGNPRQQYYSSSCRSKMATKHTELYTTLHAQVSLKKRELSVYYRRGIKKVIKITPKYKELWDLCEAVEKFHSPKLIEVPLNG